jgi:hypothetical protein
VASIEWRKRLRVPSILRAAEISSARLSKRNLAHLHEVHANGIVGGIDAFNFGFDESSIVIDKAKLFRFFQHHRVQFVGEAEAIDTVQAVTVGFLRRGLFAGGRPNGDWQRLAEAFGHRKLLQVEKQRCTSR